LLKVNLLPLDLQRKAQEKFNPLWFLILVPIVVVSLIPWYFSLQNKIKSLEADLELTKSKIEKYKDIDKQNEDLKKDIAALEEKINFIEDKKKKQQYWTTLLDRLTVIIPPNISISSMNATADGLIQITAETFQFKDIANFMRTINASKFFISPKLSASNKQINENDLNPEITTFTLSFAYKEDAEVTEEPVNNKYKEKEKVKIN